MRFGVVVFPASNCDHDCHHAVQVMGEEVSYIWHQDTGLDGFDCLILPGGFSYGDYLRTGAIAHLSPVMEAVRRFADEGGLVIGICNGFQILLESGLLPGAMLINRKLKFICRFVDLRVENDLTSFTSAAQKGQVLSIPIAHYQGNYFAPPEVLAEMEKDGQIVLRYCDGEGNVTDEANPNGSLENIAGICNKEGNIFGLMPHPERAVEALLGSEDGQVIFRSIIESVKDRLKTEELKR